MADFEKAYAPVKAWEGGWCNVPGDAGGETYAGVARAFYPNWPGWRLVDAAKKHSSFREGPAAFSAHLADVPGLADMVLEFYRVEWWDALGIECLPQKLADEIFEQSVNLGRAGAGKRVQRLCNSFNWHRHTGRPLFEDLVPDGVIGPKTIAALGTVLDQRPDMIRTLVHGLNCLQGSHYIDLAARSFTHRKFLAGWMTRTHDSKE